MNVLWLMPPSKIEGEVPLVSQNRWFKYIPFRCNFIYPVIAAYGATMIKEAGHDIRFWDCPAENMNQVGNVLDKISRYDLVIMEGRIAIMTWVWKLAQWFKDEHPELRVALYGDHVMRRPYESLAKGVDFVINCGDYDYGALRLVHALDTPHGDLEMIKALPTIKHCFNVPLMENLDLLPFIDRNLIPWENYMETWRHREAFGWIQSGRGCPCYCTFCSWVYTFYNHVLRTMSVERVVNEVEYATEKYGIREYLDDADTFLTKFGMGFARELLNRGIDVYWNMQTRADEILKGNVDDWRLMKKSGLHIVKLGVDGGNNSTLQRIKKGYTQSTVEQAVQRLQDANLEVHVNMIVGWPWETKKEAYNVIRWVRKLKPNQAQFSLPQPFIGTPLYLDALAHGWFVDNPDDYDTWDMKSPILEGEMNAKEIAQLHKDAWRTFYFSPRFVVGQFWKSCRHAWHEKNLDSFRHLWRGYKGVRYGHMEAVNG